MNDLRAAVAGLTAPVAHEHHIEGRARPHVTMLPCLLDQLEESIASTMGGAGGSKAAKNARSVLNSDALYIALTIKSQIGDWCRHVGIRPGKDAAANLLAWEDTKPDVGEFYIRKLVAWREQIIAFFTPARHREVTEPCPVCKESVWVDGEGEVKPHPVDITYVEDEFLTTAKAICRACGTSWDDAASVAELGDELVQNS